MSEEINGEEKLSPEIEAEFNRLADSWYAGWSHKGRTGFLQALRIAFAHGKQQRDIHGGSDGN